MDVQIDFGIVFNFKCVTTIPSKWLYSYAKMKRLVKLPISYMDTCT